jgi:hypothetical protein
LGDDLTRFAGTGAGRHARANATAALSLGLPELISALGLTATPDPFLIYADKALRLDTCDREAIVAHYLKALTKAADQGCERLDALKADRQSAVEIVSAHAHPRLITFATDYPKSSPTIYATNCIVIG